jgi:hypothetical protein
MAVSPQGSLASTEEEERPIHMVLSTLSKIPPFFWVLLGLLGFAAIVFRAGIISDGGPYPQGTNALNAYLEFWFLRRFPNGVWLYPYTDWGQPSPWFTGPSVLTPFILAIDPSTLVRAIEVTAWVGAGLSTYVVARKLGLSSTGAGTAGFYYSVMANVSQYFEGHVSTMISIAVLPLAFWFAYRLFRQPTVWIAAGAAGTAYLLASIGDLSILYMFLFFGIPLVGYAIATCWRREHYHPREILCIVAGFAMFVLLMLSWAYPYFLGARPQYFTGITVTVFPFGQTTGEGLLPGFLGFLNETSFVSYSYGLNNYSLGDTLVNGPLTACYLLIPVGILAYVVLWPSRDRIVLYVAAILAMIISTGPVVPALSSVNLQLYDYIPYFNSNPTLTRWALVTLLAYSMLLASGISHLERWARGKRVERSPTLERLRRRARKHVSESMRPVRGVTPSHASQRPWVVLVVVSAAVALTVSQNALIVTQPPGFFQFPSAYTAGSEYIAGQPVRGGTFEVPFGAVYERTPWAGVSASAPLMALTYTGSDTALFEAGTSYSLALDQFLGNGIVHNGSRDMVKFLAAVNTQFILATKYPDWRYASSSEYLPMKSYDALFNQTGLGNPAFQGGYQTVFDISDFAGNVSFDPTYFVYFLNSSELYQVVNSSYYTGPTELLVDGTTVGVALPQYIAHASGVIVPERPPAGLADVLSLARTDGVPVFDPNGSAVAGGPSKVTFPSHPTSYRDLAEMADPTRISYTSPTAGWGVLELAQTYSSLWNLVGAGWDAHAIANVGLNAWLVNATNGSVWTVEYQGSVWLDQSLYLEAIGWALLAAVVAVAVVRRLRGARALGPQS